MKVIKSTRTSPHQQPNISEECGYSYGKQDFVKFVHYSNYIGKLRTNFGGSACTLYDTIEREHASIIFSKEHQGALARIKQDTDPRVMRVLVPNVNNNGHMKLKNGSLLLMLSETQHHWEHSIPKRLKVKNQRVNLTFRKIL